MWWYFEVPWHFDSDLQFMWRLDNLPNIYWAASKEVTPGSLIPARKNKWRNSLFFSAWQLSTKQMMFFWFFTDTLEQTQAEDLPICKASSSFRQLEFSACFSEYLDLLQGSSFPSVLPQSNQCYFFLID